MIREVLRMGDPRLLQRSAPVDAFGTPELDALLAGPARHDGGAERRRARGAADRRAAAGRHLRRRAQPALSGRRARALHRARQSGADAAVARAWRRTGRAACRCPGLRGVVPRFRHLRYEGFDPRGQPIRREVTGFHARVVQHECDHLLGILYPMRMRDLSRFGFTDILFPDSAAGAERVSRRRAPPRRFRPAAAARRARSRAAAAPARRADGRRRSGTRPRRARPAC